MYGDGTDISSETRFAVTGANISQLPTSQVSPLGQEWPFSNSKSGHNHFQRTCVAFRCRLAFI